MHLILARHKHSDLSPEYVKHQNRAQCLNTHNCILRVFVYQRYHCNTATLHITMAVAFLNLQDFRQIDLFGQ